MRPNQKFAWSYSYICSETFLIDFGVLVLSWPLVPGCDAGGVVVKAGKNAVSALGEHFKEGDRVCGCTRLGSPGYATFQEYVGDKDCKKQLG